MDFGGFLMPVFVLVVMLSRLLQMAFFVVSRFALVPMVSSIVVMIGVRTGNPGPGFVAIMRGGFSGGVEKRVATMQPGTRRKLSACGSGSFGSGGASPVICAAG
jgi:hypothetical protein